LPETVYQSGDRWLKLTLAPHKKGLLLEVKVHPLIEEFMQGMSGGISIPVTDITGPRYNQWEPTDPDAEPLRCYRPDDHIMRRGDTDVMLNSVGTNIVCDDERVNLSFLTLAGISEGLSFVSIKETYPLSYRRQLKVKIGDAFRDFVREFIRPVRITLVMTGQEF
jgi:hypothetical protein